MKKLLLFLIVFASLSLAVEQGICNEANGHPSGSDCVFNTNPGQVRYLQTGQCGSYLEYNCNGGSLSKYENGCVGFDYYDFSQSNARLTTWKSGSVCLNSGDTCSAYVSRNDPRCGYVQPTYVPTYYPTPTPYVPPSNPSTTPPSSRGSSGGSGAPQDYQSGSYGSGSGSNYGYCGDGYCSYGESAYSCPYDCGVVVPSYSYCSLYSLPRTVSVGSYSEIRVSYVNIGYSPYSALVYCGNGRLAYASGCYGNTGYCFASCYFDQPGYYVQTASLGGSYCSPSSVTVLGNQPNPTSGPNPTPTVVKCADGTLNGQCSIVNQPKYCVNGVLVNQASVCGCPAGQIASGDSCIPKPSVTPQPTINPVFPASCRVSANPTFLDASGNSIINVYYQDFTSPVSSTLVDCGNGFSTTAQCDNGKSGSCIASCDYSQTTSSKTYSVRTTVQGIVCASSTVTVKASSSTTPTGNGGLLVTVRDESTRAPISSAFVTVRLNGQTVGTGSTDVSGQSSFTLNSGSYSVSAGKNGYDSKTITASVVSSQTTQVEILLKKLASSPTSCNMIVSPTTVRGGGSVAVSLTGSGQGIVSCGNGQVQQVSCSGNCVATCSYGSENYYPQYYSVSATVGGLSCGSQQVSVIQPVSSTGGLLARVTDCATGSSLQSVSVVGAGQAGSTDSQGLVNLQGLSTGVQSFSFSKNGYQSTSSTSVIESGKTSSLSVCLNKQSIENNCGFNVELISSPQCPYSVTQQPYQVKITRNQLSISGQAFVLPPLPSGLPIAIKYSNNALSGPSSVFLKPGEATIVDLYSNVQDSAAGGTNTVVSFTDNSCTKNLMLQACQSGGLTIESIPLSKEGFVGVKQCFNLLVRNKGLAKALVTLSASQGEFSQKQFLITSQETKDLEYCVTPQNSGFQSYLITAQSEIGTAFETVSLNAFGQSSFSDSASECQTISASTTLSNVDVSVYNGALSGDFDVEVSGNDLNAMIVQDKLYGFEKGSTRIIQLRLDGFQKEAGDYRFDVLLKQNGRTVYQKNVCYRIAGESRSSIAVSPGLVSVQAGKSSIVQVSVTNTGTIAQTYSIFVDSNQVSSSINPSNLFIKPGDVGVFDVVLTGSNLGTYSVPIRLRRGTSNYYNTYNNNNQNSYSVSVDCGNGRYEYTTCYAGSNACSVSCNYPYVGSFTPRASIGGITCEPTRVNVVSNFDNECWIDYSTDHLLEDGSVSVSVNYRNLNQNSNSFNLNCGNGQTSTLYCSGTSGSCTATCNYDNDGTFEISAYNSFKTCKPAKIAVSDDSVVSCKLSASEPTIEDGYNSRIQLNYRGLGGSTSTSSVDSVNVLVNVVGQKTEFVPLVSENLYLTLPSQVEVTPGSSTSFNLVVKNNFYYSLKSVLISTKNAPSGVFIQPVAPFALDAGEERNIRVIVTADKTALIGTHSFTIKADSPSASSKDYSVTLKVKELSPKELLVSVSQPRFEFTQVGDNQEILMTIPVTNNEAGAFSYRVLMDLPEGWSFEAQDFSLAGGESTDLIVKLIAPNYEDKDYEVALRLQSGDKLKVIPLTVPAKSRSSLTGLFTAFNSIESIIILFIVIGLLIAGYFALKSRNTEVGGEQVK